MLTDTFRVEFSLPKGSDPSTLLALLQEYLAGEIAARARLVSVEVVR